MVSEGLPLLALVDGCGLCELTDASIVRESGCGFCELTNASIGRWVWS